MLLIVNILLKSRKEQGGFKLLCKKRRGRKINLFFVYCAQKIAPVIVSSTIDGKGRKYVKNILNSRQYNAKNGKMSKISFG